MAERRRQIIGVIPARLESTRLERKALRRILGHSMITWVYRRARQSRVVDRLVVATDSEEILEHCRRAAIPATLTSRTHSSGTDRIFEVMGRDPESRARNDVYVNIQGDEPTITAAHLDLLLGPFLGPVEGQTALDPQVTTLKVEIPLGEARDPNNVKVVTDLAGWALYFSRSLVPFDRDPGHVAADDSPRRPYYKHLGLYAFTAAALERFHQLPPSPLEQRERLEQLRFLENGMPMLVLETHDDTIGVDTEEDLRKVEDYFHHTGAALPAELA